jgi:4-phosphopantoate--beta-alanine ligase
MTRKRLAEFMEQGIVHPTGLIAHGRGEAFDYLIGERSQPFSLISEEVAAYAIMNAKHPVISVNGNVAALCAPEVVSLAKATSAHIEVNLFHRSEERVRKIEALLRNAGADDVITEADYTLKNVHSSRSMSAHRGTGLADVMLIPLEDGDRAEALASLGKCVISIDLNPLSRTSRVATISIVDEVSRALANIRRFVQENKVEEMRARFNSFNNKKNLGEALEFIARRLRSIAEEQA